jgi:hypothetical protein
MGLSTSASESNLHPKTSSRHAVKETGTGLRGSWTRPRNLGARVNSPWKDEYPYVSADGKYLFFNSNRPSLLYGSPIPDGPGNIYWVDASVVEELRPTGNER